MCLTASVVLSWGFTWTCVFTTSAGCVTREARTPARTPQLKLATGAEGDKLISSGEQNAELAGSEQRSVTAKVNVCIDFLTLRQRGLGLAVEHDVDPRERNVPEQGGHEAGEQSGGAFAPTHAAQRAAHAHVAVPAALEHRHKQAALQIEFHTESHSTSTC